jgi:hypothetical protein
MESLRPLADRHPADTQMARDLGLGELAGAEQSARFEPAFFELLGGQSLRLPHSYDCSPARWFVN